MLTTGYPDSIPKIGAVEWCRVAVERKPVYIAWLRGDPPSPWGVPGDNELRFAHIPVGIQHLGQQRPFFLFGALTASSSSSVPALAGEGGRRAFGGEGGRRGGYAGEM